VDGSAVGLENALWLAGLQVVTIGTLVADLGEHVPTAGSQDTVVLISVHLPAAIRARAHARAAPAPASGGLLVIEAYTPGQLASASGGQKQRDVLYEEPMPRDDFADLEWNPLVQQEVFLGEGRLDGGHAAVIRGIGRRPC
jgi:hypothetical protein